MKTLLGCSLRHYWRAHLAAAAGVALTAAVITGALLVGDSVRGSLRAIARERLGAIEVAVGGTGFWFAEHAAAAVGRAAQAPRAGGGGEGVAAPLVMLTAVAQPADPTARTAARGAPDIPGPAADAAAAVGPAAAAITVVGADDRLWALAERPVTAPARGEVLLGADLARGLGARPGTPLIVRVARPQPLSREAPLAAGRDRATVRLRLTVREILGPDQLGRLALGADQRPARNAFCNLAELQERLGQPGRVNLIVAGHRGGPRGAATGKSRGGAAAVGGLRAAAVEAVLAGAMRPDWVGWRLRPVADGGALQIEADSIYLPPELVRACAKVPGATAASAYLLNTFAKVAAANPAGPAAQSPYGFAVAAAPLGDGPPPFGDSLGPDEMAINGWLAERLGVAAGDRVTVRCFGFDDAHRLAERAATFRVGRVIPMAEAAGRRSWVPDFPGLSDVDRCADWDIGLPLDRALLADKANEAYWETYRTTPKVFLGFEAARQLWQNRFGFETAVRLPGVDADTVTALMRRELRPPQLGMPVTEVRAAAAAAAAAALDFGQLFLGMSLFLVVSALLLATFLFALGAESRCAELGLLMATGWTVRQARALWLAETAVVALVGAVAGALAGPFYAGALLRGLATRWPDAVADLAVTYHGAVATPWIGGGAALLAALLATAGSLRGLSRRAPVQLLNRDLEPAVAAARGEDRHGGDKWAVSARPPYHHGEAPCILDPSSRDRSRPLMAGFNHLWHRQERIGRPGRGTRAAGRAAFMAAGTLGSLAFAVIGWAVATRPPAVAPAFFGAGAALLAAGFALLWGWLQMLGRTATAAVPRRFSLGRLAGRGLTRRPGRNMAVAGMIGAGVFLALAVVGMQEDVAGRAGERSSGTGGFALYAEAGLPLAAADIATIRERLPEATVVPVRMRAGEDASCRNLNRVTRPTVLGVPVESLVALGAFVGRTDNPWPLLARTAATGPLPALAGDADTATWGLRVKADPATGDLVTVADDRGRPVAARVVGTLPLRLTIFQGRLLVAATEFERRFPGEEGYRVLLLDVPAAGRAAAGRFLAETFADRGLVVENTADRLRHFYRMERAYLAMFLVLGGLGVLLGACGAGAIILRNLLERRRETALLAAVGYGRRQLAAVLLVESGAPVAAGVLWGGTCALLALAPALVGSRSEVPWPLVAGMFAALVAGGSAVVAAAVGAALGRGWGRGGEGLAAELAREAE